MEKSQMKILGIVCLVVCLICVFVAVERYQTNTKNVRAVKQFMNNNAAPLGSMMSTEKMRATTPPN